ncbi:pyridoxal phosphate-dependent transferase [Aspergillus karnatakaensis]|uniref:aminotransferase class I/II-fold pyridoxal phosphate-dependent enzyme n=1 Tax=Aspergillus karnatakaensis TaxID=1810916 RepID=UPI003CCE3E34
MERFYQKLKEKLDSRRREARLINPPSETTKADMIDFSSNDTLSLSSSRLLTEGFMHQINTHPDFIVGSRSARSLDGTQDYLIGIENYLAAFHRSETAMFFNSGFDANVAIRSSLPLPGDFVLHDQYVHASIHDGMRKCRAETVMFRHSDVGDLRRCLGKIKEENKSIAKRENHVFVALESFYSMDGDLLPIEEVVRASREVMPGGNYLLCFDEAHSNGLVGPNGSGLVCHYGLEDEFPIRLATCGEGLGFTGAAVLCRDVVKQTLINYVREVIFTTALTSLTVCAVRVGYEILASKEGERRRHALQQNIHTFYHLLTTSKTWSLARRKNVIYMPMEETWERQPFLSPIVGLITTDCEKVGVLADRLADHRYFTNVVHSPLVPKGMDRIRLMIHANNTKEQIRDVVRLIVEWVDGEIGG